ncbi:MAG: hypothetical protein U0768_16495 [Anaerolineae bacterium]
MSERNIEYDCWHPDCKDDPRNTIALDIPDKPADDDDEVKTKDIIADCKRGHTNILTVPAAWGYANLVLGRLPGVGGKLPVFKGRQA